MANSKTAQGWPGDSVPVAVVTGAGEGIGRAIAHQLASDGLRIVVNDLHEDRAEAVRTEIEDAGGSAVLHAGDVSDRGDVERLSATVRDWAGRVDVLVNNAGIALPKVPTENQDVDRWQKEIDVLLRGPYLCSRQIGTDFMLPARFGRIVNIASIVGMVGFPMVNAYGPAKAGVVMLTKTLAPSGPATVSPSTRSRPVTSPPPPSEDCATRESWTARRCAAGSPSASSAPRKTSPVPSRSWPPRSPATSPESPFRSTAGGPRSARPGMPIRQK